MKPLQVDDCEKMVQFRVQFDGMAQEVALTINQFTASLIWLVTADAIAVCSMVAI